MLGYRLGWGLGLRGRVSVRVGVRVTVGARVPIRVTSGVRVPVRVLVKGRGMASITVTVLGSRLGLWLMLWLRFGYFSHIIVF